MSALRLRQRERAAPPVALVRDLATGLLLGERLRVADSMWSRLRGLLRHPEPEAGEGLLIEPCNGIHTVGMRYPIDVLFVAPDGVVLRCERALPPGRFVPYVAGSRRVLELPAGTIEANGTAVGHRLAIVIGVPR
jgi:uncharacterized membrane protein (UPF0127 family)